MATNEIKRSKWWLELCEVLEQEFPKGECKERGGALVLLSYAEIVLQKQKAELEQAGKVAIKEVIEKIIKMFNHTEMLEMRGKEYTEGFEKALYGVLDLLKAK